MIISILIISSMIIFGALIIFFTGWICGYNKADDKSFCPTCRDKRKELVKNMNDWRLEKLKKKWKK